MRYIKYAVFVVAILIAGHSYAKPVDRGGLSIQRIHPMAVDRTHCASCSGITAVHGVIPVAESMQGTFLKKMIIFCQCFFWLRLQEKRSE